MKSNLLSLIVLCTLLVGCSSKEPLKGKREGISLSEDNYGSKITTDKSPVVIGLESENLEFTQAFLNSTHCYPPLKISQNLSNIWTLRLDYESSKSNKMMASPIAAEGKIFCIDAGGIVYAIDQKTGSQIWRMSSTVIGKDGQIGGAIAYDRGRVIVTSCFSESFSIDAKTGKILWRVKLPASSKGDGISVYEGKAFILCSNSTIQVVNIDDGKILWSHSGTTTESAFVGSASVAIADGLVFIAYPSGEIYALQIETGNPIWESLFSKISLTNTARTIAHPRACPVVKDGIVYFVAANEQTAAFDTKTGRKLWFNNYGGIQTPTVSGNSIFIFNSRSELVCLNRYSGELRWKSNLDPKAENPSDWYGQILVKDHIVMLSPDGNLAFVSVYDGKVKKVSSVGSRSDGISLNPIICNSAMYILTNSGELSKYK